MLGNDGVLIAIVVRFPGIGSSVTLTVTGTYPTLTVRKLRAFLESWPCIMRKASEPRVRCQGRGLTSSEPLKLVGTHHFQNEGVQLGQPKAKTRILLHC